VIALPPSFVGATNATLTVEALILVATTLVGASGTVTGATGVTAVDAAEGTELPTAFVAITVNV
jgi:hypothetical protein